MNHFDDPISFGYNRNGILRGAHLSSASKRPDVPHVVVLGGGYVAYSLVRRLAGDIRQGRVRCTVISRENFHAFHGWVNEMVTGRIGPTQMLSPLRRIVAPADLHVAEIESVDLDARTVTTSRKLDGRRFVLSYDHLVIGLGTVDRIDVYPGLAEHAFRLRTYPDCFRLRNHIVQMFELADIEDDPDERRRLLTFFVAGGGYAGTELIGELADFARLLRSREYPKIRPEECRFVLVEPGLNIVPELTSASGVGFGAHPRLAQRARARLQQLGAEVHTGTAVTAVTPNEVWLSSGERVPTRTVVSAVGTRPNPLVVRLPVEHDERGRVITDAYLRVPGWPGVWAGGDCASVPNPRGGTCPSTGLYAIFTGRRIGRNLHWIVNGRRPRRFNFIGLGQTASVGRRWAIAELYGVEAWGLPAWLIWRSFLLYYTPSWDVRLRLLADWSVWPLIGRQIVQMSVDRPVDYDLQQNIFQPGEEIAAEQRSTRYIHIIVDGEVEIREDGSNRVLATLGPGGHFGVRWIESFKPERAVARTVVRTIAIRRDQAQRLQEVLQSAAELRAQSGHFPSIDIEAAAAVGKI
jgi:NADH:ubiquinone reductase (H+-translocating)